MKKVKKMSKIWDENLTPRIKEYILSRFNLAIQYRFPKKDFKQLQVHIREYLDEVIIQFLYSIGTKIQDKDIHFNTFKRWQDHFKFVHRKKWWMRWWVKRYPIEFGKHKYKIQQCTVFPELEIPDFLKDEIRYVYYNWLEGKR